MPCDRACGEVLHVNPDDPWRILLSVRGRASPGTHVLFLHMNVKYPRLVMGSLTGIELGGDTCVLVRVRAGGDAIRLLAVGGTLSPDWDPALPLVDNLRRARRSGRFPKHATVVAWDLHESASASDPLSRAVLAPLRDAGFAVDAVLCPADALCALAKRRQKTPGRAGEVWLALNRQRVAMAIVEDRRLLYSRGFDWHYSPAATQRAELLQRYSLVAHLAPEVRHGIDLVRVEHGASVSAIVTCGDLPDLRSLTMPLIEELDIEVETLDTLDGVSVEGVAAGETIAEHAPAIRLACAAASGSAASGNERWRLVAAAVVLLAILVGAWTVMRSLSGSRAGLGPQEQSRQSEAAPIRSSRPPAATAPEGAVAVSPPAIRMSGTANTVPQPPVQSAPAPRPAESPAATTGRTPPPPEPAPPADSRVGASSAARPAVQRRAPLSSPLPIVNSILVAPDRRLAVLDGEIVREGDAIGPRVVVRIETWSGGAPRAVGL
jgi:hypothetical protein